MIYVMIRHRGVQEARDAYYRARANGEAPPVGGEFKYVFDFGADQYLLSYLTLDGTGHFLGSYTVLITDLGDGTLQFRVENPTNLASATNLRLSENDVPLFSPDLYPTGNRDTPMPRVSTPFKTILPAWRRGETFYGSFDAGGNLTQYYIWLEALWVDGN
jgi:hypothetical protein